MMRHGFLLPVFIAGLALTGANAAVSKPVYTTKYSYYTISGGTPAELYAAMIARGPHVNGAKAYASTAATSSQEGKLAQGKSCQIEDYRLKIDFLIKLPKLRNEEVLPTSVKSQWRQFSTFLKRHEETHRSIWLECARDLEAKVQSIRAASCSDADAKTAKLWTQMRASCSRKHDAFDAAEQKQLLKHPFVKLVMSQKNRQTVAASMPAKTKKK